MKFKLSQAHKSLPAGLEWDNIPDFAIITGQNGTGKSHLLEAMNNQNNWEGQPFLQKDIKYIPPMHNFVNTANTTRTAYMEQRSQTYSQVVAVFKMFQKPDIKGVIKSLNIDLLRMAETPYQNGEYEQVLRNVLNPTIFNAKFRELNSILANVFQQKLLFSDILKKTQKNRIEDITEEEFLYNLPPDIENDFTDTSHLKRWFILYLDNFNKKSGDAVSNHNKQQIQDLHNDKKPWVLMNEILIKHKFKYKIENFNPNITHPKIEFTDGNTIVQIEELSSGEQQIISLVAWAHHEIISQNIKLLLLDEPDAHLHPSFCKIFIDIMKKYVVVEHKIKVIMTTHSPSTIAYAPPESIFVMNDAKCEGDRIQKVDKDTALNTLSDGLMTLQEGGKILSKIHDATKCVVFVEGQSDVIHFELACKKLNKESLGLQFISGYGLDRLENFLKGCPYNLLFDKTVIGIFDNDEKGQNSFNNFTKEWEFTNDQDFIKKKKGSNAYIMKLPLLDEHSLFCENTIELYYSKEILESNSMINKRTLKEINAKDVLQMNDDDYSNKGDLKYYKLCSTKDKNKSVSDKEKNDFAEYCKTLDCKEFENFQEIFSLIETIISSSTSTK